MIWLVRTLVGLWILGCAVRDAEATMRAARALWRWTRRPDELAPPPVPPLALPNFVDGVVLPAAHDPRWKLLCETQDKGELRFCYLFGDIKIYDFAIFVRIGVCGVHTLGDREEAAALYKAIGDATKQADKTRALHQAKAITAGPSISEEDWQALAKRYPEPTSRG